MKSTAASKKQPAFSIQNSSPGDWKDPQQMMELFAVTIRTLRYYRKNNIVPSGKVFYYLPGFLKTLEQSACD